MPAHSSRLRLAAAAFGLVAFAADTTYAGNKHARRSLGNKHALEDALARRAEFASSATAAAAAPAAAAPAASLSSSSIALTASPSTLTTPLADVNVTWSGVPEPQSNDWLALYCSGAPLDEWIDWEYVSDASPSTWQKGEGATSFFVWRGTPFCAGDHEVRLYRDPSPYTLLATSNPIAFAGGQTPTTPYEVHITHGSPAATTMIVTFTTNTSCAAVPSLVRIGSAPGVWDVANVTVADCPTYAAAELCTANANVTSPEYYAFPGFFHHASVTGLRPSTTYSYLPVQGTTDGPMSTFTTPPLPASPPSPSTYPFNFVTFGDMYVSGAPGATETASRIAARLDAGEPLASVVLVGDLGYALGSASRWAQWVGLIEPVASRIPFVVSVGNHEYAYVGSSDNDPSGVTTAFRPSWWNGGSDSDGECGVPVSRRFRGTGNGNGVFWHSFEAGPVHFALLSSEHDPSPTSPMGTWLAADLASVDRSRTPWVLVGIHRPLYETEDYPSDNLVAAGLRGILEPLLLEHKVDVVVSAHYHAFLRTCPISNGTCGPTAQQQQQPGQPTGLPIHYVTGAAGQSLDNAPLIPSKIVEKYDGSHYGYSIVRVANASALRLSWYWNQDDSLQDDVWIYR